MKKKNIYHLKKKKKISKKIRAHTASPPRPIFLQNLPTKKKKKTKQKIFQTLVVPKLISKLSKPILEVIQGLRMMA